MNKYLSVFKISFQQEFVYRINFIMWRVRNLLRFFLVFFLWDTVFSDPNRVLFGYDRSMILTYVFGLLIIRGFVFSARSFEAAGEISRGDLSNYLVKPLSYFKYWLSRDMSSKVLNLVFAVFETIILFLILKPPFFVQKDPVFLIGFLFALILATFIYFVMLFLTSSIPFWVPEAGWGAHFLVSVILVEFLSGALFPLDVLPGVIQKIINYTPFPYLLFFPIQIYLGKISGPLMFRGILVSLFWAVILWIIFNSVWKRGLKVYQAHGR